MLFDNHVCSLMKLVFYNILTEYIFYRFLDVAIYWQKRRQSFLVNPYTLHAPITKIRRRRLITVHSSLASSSLSVSSAPKISKNAAADRTASFLPAYLHIICIWLAARCRPMSDDTGRDRPVSSVTLTDDIGRRRPVCERVLTVNGAVCICVLLLAGERNETE